MSASAAQLARLRSRIAALEGLGREAAKGAVALGCAPLDRALPWGGLPLGCVHEMVPAQALFDGAALGFAAFALGRLAAARRRPVLWVAGRDLPYAPGLAALGLAPESLLVVRSFKPAQTAWVLEEALRSPGLAGVLGEVRGLDMTAARRLQLAARESGVAGLLVNRGAGIASAVTRWRIAPAPSAPGEGVGAGRWRVELTRCRGRAEEGAAWEVEWDEASRGLRLAAAVADRPAAPGRLRAAG